ncbi:transcriptional regulator [Caulobacter sp. AP07]|uniref:TetR/AcrR family transcriptional regulator n=1 Tax=Caulobacter sp. AP07 TaxID=1144304 RepID=UPI0002720C51|nr:TetR/AcrR family transcriptional regulator [Caulobacter sp. AP07]EJL27326.1 transcriptional regulator [Caulobacter sp. AP07]
MSDRSSKPLGRPRGFDRGVALHQALHEFWRHGYQATSIASLTSAMNIQPPSLYAAFGDKSSLFRECVGLYRRIYENDVTEAFQEEPTARRAIERMLGVLAVQYTDPTHPPGCLIISATAAHGADAAEVAEELRQLREGFKAGLAARIAHDVGAGILPPKTDAKALAVSFAATIQGMSCQAQDGASREDLQAIARLAMAAWPTAQA